MPKLQRKAAKAAEKAVAKAATNEAAETAKASEKVAEEVFGQGEDNISEYSIPCGHGDATILKTLCIRCGRDGEGGQEPVGERAWERWCEKKRKASAAKKKRKASVAKAAAKASEAAEAAEGSGRMGRASSAATTTAAGALSLRSGKRAASFLKPAAASSAKSACSTATTTAAGARSLRSEGGASSLAGSESGGEFMDAKGKKPVAEVPCTNPSAT